MIPHDSSEVEDFTPPSLKNVVPKISFRFRAATERDTKRYGHALTLEGLRLFGEDLIRAEMLRVLKANWSPETYEEQQAILNTIWAKTDQALPVSADEANWTAEITMKCLEVSHLLRRMDADNRRFADEAPAVALGMFLAGWSGLETPFRLDAGQVPFGTMEKLRAEIGELEKKAKADKVEGVNPGLAFMELSLHAFGRLNLTKEEEKNSSAPSLSSETPNGSEKAPESRDGASENTSSGRKKTRSRRSRGSTKTSSSSGTNARTASAGKRGRTAAPSSTSP